MRFGCSTKFANVTNAFRMYYECRPNVTNAFLTPLELFLIRNIRDRCSNTDPNDSSAIPYECIRIIWAVRMKFDLTRVSLHSHKKRILGRCFCYLY